MADYVYDTFTDADGTLLQSHTGEVAATWGRLFVAWAQEAEIQSNTLQQKTGTPEDDGWVYRCAQAATALGSLTDYDIEIVTTFNEVVNANFIILFQNAAAEGDIAGTDLVAAIYAGTEILTAGVPHTCLIQIRGADVTLYVNSVFMWTNTLAGPPDKDFGIYVDLSPGDTLDAIAIDSFRISDPAGPPPPPNWWADKVGTSET